jgi:predicted N-acetyltransferase YhbS
MLITRAIEDNKFEKVKSFYKEAGFASTFEPSDIFLVAEEGEIIMAALRFCREYGCLVLRGMRVLPYFQRQGIGSKLLQFSKSAIGDDTCYCIPHSHLEEFYAQIGFERIEPDEAPRFLQDRLAMYLSELWLDVILMRKSVGPGNIAR